MQRIKGVEKSPVTESCSVLGEDRAFAFALVGGAILRPVLPVQNSPLLCKSALGSEIISCPVTVALVILGVLVIIGLAVALILSDASPEKDLSPALGER